MTQSVWTSSIGRISAQLDRGTAEATDALPRRFAHRTGRAVADIGTDTRADTDA